MHRQFGHHVHRGFCFPFVGDAQGLHWQYLPTFVLVTTLHRCAQRFCCFFALGLRINIERTSKLPAKEIRRVGVLLRSFFFCDHLEPPTDSYSRVIFSDHWEPRQIFRIQLRRIERKWVQTARRLIHKLVVLGLQQPDISFTREEAAMSQERHKNCFKIWSGRFSKNWETQPDTSPTRERTAMSQEQHKYYFKIWSGRFPKLGNFQRIVEKTVTERHQDCFYRWPGRFPRLGNTISHFIYERKDNHVTKTVLFLLQDMLWPISKNGETYSWLLKKLQCQVFTSYWVHLGCPFLSQVSCEETLGAREPRFREKSRDFTRITQILLLYASGRIFQNRWIAR